MQALRSETGGRVALQIDGGVNDNTIFNGGAAVDYEYVGFILANGDDEIEIVEAGVVIDRVAYDGGPSFPEMQRSARPRERKVSRRSCARNRAIPSGVSAGSLPSGGSTISDVRRFGRIGVCQLSKPNSAQS